LIAEQYKEILGGPPSREAINIIINNAGNDPERFRILADIILTGKEPIPSRASWALEGIDAQYPKLCSPYITKFIDALPKFTHPGTRRNILKILERKNIPVKYHGKIADLCFEYLTKNDVPVAIQVYSMQIIANLSDKYPELMQELAEILDNRMPASLPGFKARAKKILQKRK